jgi:hypothetical protein
MSEDGREELDPQQRLFEIPEAPAQDSYPAEPAVLAPQFPVWTDNKARLIRWYLYYFVLITKHGTSLLSG